MLSFAKINCVSLSLIGLFPQIHNTKTNHLPGTFIASKRFKFFVTGLVLFTKFQLKGDNQSINALILEDANISQSDSMLAPTPQSTSLFF